MSRRIWLAMCLAAAGAMTGGDGAVSFGQTAAVANGNWSNSAAWSAGEPTDTVPATIDGGFTVTVDQAGEVANLLDVGTVAGETGNLNVTGGDLTITDADMITEPNIPSIRIGQAAGSTGNFTMSGGTVFIDGGADTGFAIGDLLVGDVGNGSMTMTGGNLTATDEIIIGLADVSIGTVNVSGGTLATSGRSILVGFDGNGTLNVSGTGAVTANFDMFVGFVEGSTGTFNQSGGTVEAGFMFSNFLSGGTGSTATITQTGGVFNARIAYVLGQGVGTTTMTHSGGEINAPTNNGDFVASDGGGNTSTYNISGTATVNLLHNFIVGAFPGSNGTVNQTGGTINAGGVFVGRDGVGAWNMSGGAINQTVVGGENDNFIVGRVSNSTFNHTGGTVAVAANVFLGDFDNSHGMYNISGGTLDVAGNLNVGAAIASNAAPDRVAPDGTNGPQGQALNANGTFIVNGSGGTITVDGNLLANPADKSPARNGAGEENDSILRFVTGASGVSTIDVGLLADLDGAVIDVDDAAGFFTANPAATLTLIDAAGGFGNVYTVTPTEAAGTGRAFTLAAGDAALYNVQILPSGGGEMLVASRISGGLASDVDADGDVDGNDFLLIQRGLGMAFDASDIADWRASFGMTSPATVTAAAVPEPCAAALMLIAGAALASARGGGQALSRKRRRITTPDVSPLAP